MFRLVIPDKTPKITGASEKLKSVTQAKHFSEFKIIRVHDQNAVRGFGVITTTWDELF